MKFPLLGLLMGLAVVLSSCGGDSVDHRRYKGKADAGNCNQALGAYQKLLKPIIEQRCVACHSAGRSGALSGQFAMNQDEANVMALSRMLGGDAKAIYQKASDPLKHAGGKQWEVSDEPKLVEFFAALQACRSNANQQINRTAKLCNAEPLPRRVNLLTEREYHNTVLDLTGVDIQVSIPAPRTILDANGNPRLAFANDQKSRTIDSNLAFSLQKASETVVSKISPEKRAAYGCAADALTDECIQRFGAKAFRRPLSNDELSAFRLLGSFPALLRFVLQAPDFLYISQLGDAASGANMSAYEIAATMAYALTSFPPDAELTTLAQQGKLFDSKVRAQQARRLLAAATEIDQPMVQFFADWLELAPSETASKTGSYDGKAVYRESLSFIQNQLRKGGSLSSLFTTENQGRKGILEQRAFIASHASDKSTSPVKVGKTIARNLLCLSLPPPPPGISTNLPEAGAVTTRAKLEAHTKNAACASCHSRIDPFGFAFEGFDPLGQRRSIDNGVAVDTKASVKLGLSFDRDYAGSKELITSMAESAELAACFDSFFQQKIYGAQTCEAQEVQASESITDYVARLLSSERFIKRK